MKQLLNSFVFPIVAFSLLFSITPIIATNKLKNGEHSDELGPVEKKFDMDKAKVEMDKVNKKLGTTWKAELIDHFSLLDDSELRYFMRMDDREGVQEDDDKLPEVPHQFGGSDGYEIRPKPLVAEETELEYFGQVDPSTFKAIAESEETKSGSLICNDYRFDIRNKWTECAKIISEVRDQSRCLSCYAVAGAAAFSDRFCIALTKRGWPVPPAKQDASYFSSADIMQCGQAGGKDACQGGWSHKVWRFLNENGVVSGNGYRRGGCKPYPFPPKSQTNGKSGFIYPGRCEKRCSNAEHWQEYDIDKVKTSNWHTLGLEMGWEQLIKEEIFHNGTVPVDIIAYDSFVRFYAGGIYQLVTPNEIGGGHIVRLIGYGHVNCTDGRSTKYWLGANSWGSAWGENGFFRIQRGVNEVGIESRDISFGAIAL